MILESLSISRRVFEQRTGWQFKPEGVCKGEICVPIPDQLGDELDVRVIAAYLHMPLVRDEPNDLWSLGPESGGRALASAHTPELSLPDLKGNEFRLSSLRGKKVLLVAWASW